ncbi:MAG TPA: lysophospholipid acyltransferase family protein, partial [Kiritimatiellia bacterium]
LGWCIAWPAFHLFRVRVSDACARIREVFGDRYSPREVRRIAWLSMRNFTFTAIESLRMPKLTRETATALIDIGDFQRLRDHAATGKGAILVVPHTGNWEMAGVAAHLFGLPMFLIVGKQRNLLVDAYLNRMRGVSGMEIIPRDSSTMFKKVVRNLREGKFLAFMTDLRSRTPGMRVQFLGKEANVVAGMAVFARLGNVPVFPVVVTRIGWARHKWEFFDPVCPDPALDRDPDAQRMTQAVMDIYDRAIRAQPEQYFWFNKRWVLDPLRVEECRVPGVEGVPATPDT